MIRVDGEGVLVIPGVFRILHEEEAPKEPPPAEDGRWYAFSTGHLDRVIRELSSSSSSYELGRGISYR